MVNQSHRLSMKVPPTSTQNRERAIRSPRPSNSANFALLTGIVTAPVVLPADPSSDIERPAAIPRVTLMWTQSDGFDPESDACSPSARQVPRKVRPIYELDATTTSPRRTSE